MIAAQKWYTTGEQELLSIVEMFSPEYVHVHGKDNVVADALSQLHLDKNYFTCSFFKHEYTNPFHAHISFDAHKQTHLNADTHALLWHWHTSHGVSLVLGKASSSSDLPPLFHLSFSIDVSGDVTWKLLVLCLGLPLTLVHWISCPCCSCVVLSDTRVEMLWTWAIVWQLTTFGPLWSSEMVNGRLRSSSKS